MRKPPKNLGYTSLDHLLGHLFFLVLFILALVFYQERTVTFDTSHYLFSMIKNDDFHIVHGRFGAILTQLFPFIAIKLQLSLKWIMMAYSVNFIVVLYACYLFAMRVCRHFNASRAVILFSVLSVISTFYWPVSEIFQGLIYVLITYAWLSTSRRINAILHLLVLIALLALSQFSHPLMAVPLGFILLFNGIDKKVWLRKKHFLLFLLIPLLSLALIYYLKGLNSYDKSASQSMFNFQEGLAGYFKLHSTHSFWNRLIHKYKLLCFGALAVFAFYIIRQKWLKAASISLFLTSYFVLITTSYPKGESDLITENLFLPMAMAVALLISLDLLPQLLTLKWNRMAFWTIILIGLTNLIIGHKPLSNRIIWYRTMFENIKHFDEQKILIHKSNYSEDFVPGSWPSYSESMLLSSLNSPDSSRLIRFAEEHEIAAMMSHKKQKALAPYLPWWDYLKEKDIPTKWFNLNNSLFKDLNLNNSLSLDELKSRCYETQLGIGPIKSSYVAANKYALMAEISYNGNAYFPSSPAVNKGAFISYRFYKNHKMRDRHSPKSPLIMDVYNNIKQPIYVKFPWHPGDYELEFTLTIPALNNLEIVSKRKPVKVTSW